MNASAVGDGMEEKLLWCFPAQPSSYVNYEY